MFSDTYLHWPMFDLLYYLSWIVQCTSEKRRDAVQKETGIVVVANDKIGDRLH